MYNELKDVLKELSRLTYEVHQANELNKGKEMDMPGVFDLMTFEQNKESETKDRELLNFLYSLDFEIIKIIQTIMLLGREGKSCNEDTSEEAYNELRQELDQRGWNTKEEEILYITSKGPLHDYLKSGFKLLNINL